MADEQNKKDSENMRQLFLFHHLNKFGQKFEYKQPLTPQLSRGTTNKTNVFPESNLH